MSEPGEATIRRVPTGIPGMETLTRGGVPEGQLALVSGSSGSGKTVFGAQFLAAGIKAGEPGVFVCVEQDQAGLLRNVDGLGMGLRQALDDGKFAIVDASSRTEGEEVRAGEFDLRGLIVRISHAIQRVGAKRLVVDSVGALAQAYEGEEAIRRVLVRLRAVLAETGVTGVVTVERQSERSHLATRWGLESFLADTVIILRNRMTDERRRRTVEVLKMRGGDHETGAAPFTITPGKGIRVLPLSATPLEGPAFSERISTGIPSLDAMFDGGIYQHATTLVSGPPGAGKSLLACSFAQGGLDAGEEVLFVTFEESKEQLVTNASAIGLDLSSGDQNGRFHVASIYPESRSLEEHLVDIEEIVQTVGPSRLILDSFTALAPIATSRSFREFLIGLRALVKNHGMTALYTHSGPMFPETGGVSKARVSTNVDNLILMRYLEVAGRVDKAIAVIKTRGSDHDNTVRELRITENGIEIGDPVSHSLGLFTAHGAGARGDPGRDPRSMDG